MEADRGWIDRLTNWAFSAGMIWVLAMMLLTAVDVTGRYLFSRPVLGSIEMSEFMLALFGMLGMAYTERMDANVRVTVLERFLPGRVTALLNALVYLLSAGIMALLAYQGWMTGIEEFDYRTASDNLGIPVYPFFFLLSLSTGILVLTILAKVCKFTQQVFKQ